MPVPQWLQGFFDKWIKPYLQPIVTVACCIGTLATTILIYSCTAGRDQATKLAQVDTGLQDLRQSVTSNKTDLQTALKEQVDRITAQIAKMGQDQSASLNDLKGQIVEAKVSLNKATEDFTNKVDSLKSTIGELDKESEGVKVKLEDLGKTVDTINARINSPSLQNLSAVASSLEEATKRVQHSPEVPQPIAYFRVLLERAEGIIEAKDIVTVRSALNPGLPPEVVPRTVVSILSIYSDDSRSDWKTPPQLQATAFLERAGNACTFQFLNGYDPKRIVEWLGHNSVSIAGQITVNSP